MGLISRVSSRTYRVDNNKKTMKYTIKKYTALATWHWNIPDRDNKDCPICRQVYDAPCATSKCRFPGDDCPIVFGKCQHYFHLHCIHSWNKEQNSPTCPLCRAPWEIDAAGAEGATSQEGSRMGSQDGRGELESTQIEVHVDEMTSPRSQDSSRASCDW